LPSISRTVRRLPAVGHAAQPTSTASDVATSEVVVNNWRFKTITLAQL
jgi:hypothetical protein